MSNKIFVATKYVAIASAVAMACGTAAQASTITTIGTLKKSSIQANAAAATTADITIGNFTVGLEGSYTANDVVTISITGGTFRTGTSSASNDAVVTCGTSGGSNVVLGFLSKASSAVSYRVLTTAGATSGASCVFTGAQYSIVQNSIAAGASSVSLRYTAYAGGSTGPTFDAASSTAASKIDVAGSSNQFNAYIDSAFSGTIDVATGRLGWTSDTKSRPLKVALSSDSTLDYKASAAQTAASFNVYGAAGTSMFSFLDDDANGCDASDLTAGLGSASVSAGSLSVSANCATLSVTVAAGTTGSVGGSTALQTVTLTLSKATTSTGLQIPSGVFTVAPSFTVTDASVSSQSVTALDGGSFTINGVTIVVPYMPYGTSGTSAITQSYYIANNSTVPGTVTAVARNQAGGSCNLGSVGVAGALAVTNLSAAINEKIAACYATAGVYPDGTRVYLELTSNTAAANTVLNTTYNVGGNSRVNVTNNSNRVNNQ